MSGVVLSREPLFVVLPSAAPCEGFQFGASQYWGCAKPRDQVPSSGLVRINVSEDGENPLDRLSSGLAVFHRLNFPVPAGSCEQCEHGAPSTQDIAADGLSS